MSRAELSFTKSILEVVKKERKTKKRKGNEMYGSCSAKIDVMDGFHQQT